MRSGCRWMAAVLGLVLVLPASASPAEEPRAAAEAREALFRTDLAWAAAASAGKDAGYVASFWADDGVIVPAGEPIIAGKPAILAFVTGAFATPGFHITWTPRLEDVHVSDDGTLGYSVSDSETTFPGKDGTLVTSRGRGVSIWRRQPNGDWKCVYDIWNDPPMPGQDASRR